MRFSQRMGYRPIKTVLQIESIDQDLKNRLWNFVKEDFFDKLDTGIRYVGDESEKQRLCRYFWKEFFILSIDQMPSVGSITNAGAIIKYIQAWFFDVAKWHDIYDFIEFVSGNFEFIGGNFVFVSKVNAILEKEVSGYRIINGQVTQITSEGEIAEIEEAITSSDQWKSVNTHLNAALNFLSDRKNPDYRNSIKESISAVESFCRVVLNNPDITFGKALIELEKKHSLHGSLKGAFSALYGYTSDAGGIRHALKEDDTFSNFEDAKFMLVTCSAFINYLKAKML